jgi:hypothetical protein
MGTKGRNAINIGMELRKGNCFKVKERKQGNREELQLNG